MWVDNDVPNWFPTLKNFYRSPFSKWLPQYRGRNFSMSGINSGCRNRTMLNLCGVVVAILKMATGRNFSMSGIISGHHYLPTYQILMISNNVEFLRLKFRTLMLITSK
jgi:hypothetical protein